MSRFMPSQGPGIGFKTAPVCATIFNDNIPRGTGTLTVIGRLTSGVLAALGGDGAGPYNTMVATLPVNARAKLVGVLQETGVVFEPTRVCVSGPTLVQCGVLADGAPPIFGDWSTNDYLTTTLLGDMRPAQSGETVYARALEDAVRGQQKMVDFNGDAGFGVMP